VGVVLEGATFVPLERGFLVAEVAAVLPLAPGAGDLEVLRGFLDALAAPAGPNLPPVKVVFDDGCCTRAVVELEVADLVGVELVRDEVTTGLGDGLEAAGLSILLLASAPIFPLEDAPTVLVEEEAAAVRNVDLAGIGDVALAEEPVPAGARVLLPVAEVAGDLVVVVTEEEEEEAGDFEVATPLRVAVGRLVGVLEETGVDLVAIGLETLDADFEAKELVEPELGPLAAAVAADAGLVEALETEEVDAFDTTGLATLGATPPAVPLEAVLEVDAVPVGTLLTAAVLLALPVLLLAAALVDAETLGESVALAPFITLAPGLLTDLEEADGAADFTFAADFLLKSDFFSAALWFSSSVWFSAEASCSLGFLSSRCFFFSVSSLSLVFFSLEEALVLAGALAVPVLLVPLESLPERAFLSAKQNNYK